MLRPPSKPASERRASRVLFLVLRFMRRPILVLVVVYAVSMVGWVMIPGPVIGGEERSIGLFHAFYFLTYTATTTGFGEIPFPFTDAQRMWAIVSLASMGRSRRSYPSSGTLSPRVPAAMCGG